MVWQLRCRYFCAAPAHQESLREALEEDESRSWVYFSGNYETATLVSENSDGSPDPASSEELSAL
jgi:hypothetical protein